MTKEEFIEAIRGFEVLVNSNGSEIDINFVVRNYNFDDWKIKPKTVTVNGIEVPEPLRVEPKNNNKFFIVCSCGVFDDYWVGGNLDKERLKNGAIHLTREAAQAHYDALWLPTRRIE